MIRVTVVSAMAAVMLHTGNVSAQTSCELTPIGTATVAAVHDGRTVSLADGRTLRLVGIEVTDASRTVLRQLAAGKTLRLARHGADQDRYGRLVAFAFTGDSQVSLQQALLSAGEARVGPRVGSPGCANDLLNVERTARAARRGLWSDPRFLPVKAGNVARLRDQAGHFTLVTGKVLSVHPTGGTIYLNFGQRWTRDFSVIILRHSRPRFVAAGIDPLQLEGRHLRVRGFVEMRRGPVILAETPEQIEFASEVLRSGK